MAEMMHETSDKNATRSGRRAALAYGPDVWEVIKFLREVDERGPAAIDAAAEVFAVADPPDLRSKSDEEVFAWASAERRWLLTENVKDFRPIMLRALPGGPPGCGLLFTSSRAFPRSRKNPGPLINALHAWLTAGPPAPPVTESWLLGASDSA
jgi:hypothetical protein